jgi:peroxidase
MMKIQQVICSAIIALILLSQNASALKPNYYAKTCPNLESIVRNAVQKKMAQTPIAAPATLRLFFHDCFVRVNEDNQFIYCLETNIFLNWCITYDFFLI